MKRKQKAQVRSVILGTDLISDHLRSKGSWEFDISDAIRRSLDMFENAIFLDIGANIGTHSLQVATLK